MLRQRLTDALKAAMKARDQRADLDPAPDPGGAEGPRHRRARQGNTDGVDDAEIIDLLQKMVAPAPGEHRPLRAGQPAGAGRSRRGAEIDIIERFLPQTSDAEMPTPRSRG